MGGISTRVQRRDTGWHFRWMGGLFQKAVFQRELRGARGLATPRGPPVLGGDCIEFAEY